MRATSAYLVVSTPRSGSTLLCRGLADTNLAGRPQEYFRPGGKLWSQRWEAADPVGYVEGLLAERATANGVFGAKVSWRQLRLLEEALRVVPRLREAPLPAMLDELFPELRYVRITRRDKLRQAISFLKAYQTGVWGRRPTEERASGGAAAFDFAALERVRGMLEEQEAGIDGLFAGAAVRPHLVVYEELVEAYRPTVEGVLGFLGVAVPAELELPEPRVARLADAETEEWVERYGRVTRERGEEGEA